MFRQEILVDVGGRATCKLATDFHRAVAGSQFRAATLARTIAGHLRLDCMTIKSAIFAKGSFHPADRPAINPRRFDRHKKAPVKTRIAGQNRLITLVGIQDHGDTLHDV